MSGAAVTGDGSPGTSAPTTPGSCMPCMPEAACGRACALSFCTRHVGSVKHLSMAWCCAASACCLCWQKRKDACSQHVGVNAALCNGLGCGLTAPCNCANLTPCTPLGCATQPHVASNSATNSSPNANSRTLSFSGRNFGLRQNALCNCSRQHRGAVAVDSNATFKPRVQAETPRHGSTARETWFAGLFSLSVHLAALAPWCP